MTKIKVLTVSDIYPGENKLLNRLVTGPSEDSFEVMSVHINGSSNGADTLDELGISRYLNAKTGKAGVDSVLKLKALLEEFKPDIIHCHGFNGTYTAVIASKLCGIGKVVSHVHGLNRIRTFGRKIIAKWLFRQVTMVVCVSGKVKEHMLETLGFLKEDRVEILHNGIDIGEVHYGASNKESAQKELGLNPDLFNIVNVGRLVPTKGQNDLIEGFSCALKENDKLRLYFIGDGRLLDDLKSQAESLNIADKVIFLGFRNDVLKVMCGFDLFAFSSIAEGLPLSIVEAMAAKLPVVSTKAGGIPEIFEGALPFGELADIGDSKALGDGVKKIASLNKEELKTLGDNARARAIEGFSREVMTKTLESIYRSVVK